LKKQAAILVPLKLRSRRVPNKNILNLVDRPLFTYIFDQLSYLTDICDVYAYSSTKEFVDHLPQFVRFLPRPSSLDADNVLANELFRYAIQCLQYSTIAICHATCPFLSQNSIRACIASVIDGSHDSSFTATSHKTYAWFNNVPLNYDPSSTPQTQDLNPVLLENSGVYVFKRNDYLRTNRRVGHNPYIHQVHESEGIDIDTPEDFAMAEYIAHSLSSLDRLSYARKNPPLSITPSFSLVSHICFDVDGVLLNSIPLMEEAWDSIADQYSLPAFQQYQQHLGLPFRRILQNLRVHPSRWEDIENAYFQYSITNATSLKLFDGVSEMLDALNDTGKRLSLYSSKPMVSLKRILDLSIIPNVFDHVLTPDTIPSGCKPKPHPDGLVHLCRISDIDPQSLLYVGDMPTDKLAAELAGAHFSLALWGADPSLPEDYLRCSFHSPVHLSSFFQNPS